MARGEDDRSSPAGLFAKSKDRYEACNETLGSCLNVVMSLAKHVADSESYEGDKPGDLERMQKCVEDLARFDEESRVRGTICAGLRHALFQEAMVNTDAVNELEKYKAELAARKSQWTGTNPRALSSSRDVKEIRDLVAQATGGADDLVVGGSVQESPARCPVTGKEMTAPVVCKPCGHVYSTEGAIGLLVQVNARGRAAATPPSTLDGVPAEWSAPCPQPGCRVRLSRAVLERDYRTEASQRNAKRRAAARGDGGDSDADDVDVVEL